MKKFFWILTILLLLDFAGCSSNTIYASYTNWEVSDDEFVGTYMDKVLSLIEDTAAEYGVSGEQQNQTSGNNRFDIRYAFNDFEIVFHFINDGTVAFFYSQLWHYEANFDHILEYSKYEQYLSFIDNVTNQVIFDYQGSVQSYRYIFKKKLTNDSSCCFYYHFDDLTGSIGYSIMWDDHYSQNDSRSVILFSFRGLLRNLNDYVEETT